MQRMLVKPAPSAERVTRCSWFDYFVRSITASVAWYFPERLEPERLRAALQRILSDYGEWSGRLAVRDEMWTIVHGAGAAFEVCESPQTNAALHERVQLVCPGISLFGAVRGKAPLLAVRLTHTRDGSVLGVSWHHMAGDLHSLMLLVRAWAQAYRGLDHTPPVDVLDRNQYLNEHLAAHVGDVDLLRFVRWGELFKIMYAVQFVGRQVDLHFSAQEVAAIHAAVAPDGGVTPHDALCAHVVGHLRRLEQIQQPAQHALAVNLRKRLGLPADLGGNLLDFACVRAGAESDVRDIAAELRASIVELSNQPLTFHALKRIADEGAPRALQERYCPAAYDPVQRGLFVSSWANFGLYDLTFGETRPDYVLCAPTTKGVWFALIAERPRAAGLLFRVWLPARLASRMGDAAGAGAGASELLHSAAGAS